MVISGQNDGMWAQDIEMLSKSKALWHSQRMWFQILRIIITSPLLMGEG